MDTDDGKAVDSVLTELFGHCIQKKIKLGKFENLITLLKDLPEEVYDRIELISTPKLLKDLVRKVSLLTTGSRRLIFETGTPANIETLLGMNSNSDKQEFLLFISTPYPHRKKKNFLYPVLPNLCINGCCSIL